METIPKWSTYSLATIGRQPSSLEVRTRSPLSLMYFTHMRHVMLIWRRSKLLILGNVLTSLSGLIMRICLCLYQLI